MVHSTSANPCPSVVTSCRRTRCSSPSARTTTASSLVNLEHLGVVALAGDPERTTALARHLAAELALNPWSSIVEVNVIGLGEELAAARHPPTAPPTRRRNRSCQRSSRRSQHRWRTGGATRTRTAWSSRPATGQPNSRPSCASPSSRIGTALVSLATPVPESTIFDVDQAGRLRVPALGLDLQSAGLTSEEAKACAAIVDLTRESEPVKIPPFEQAADGWRALADQAGALREDLTEVRAGRPGW